MTYTDSIPVLAKFLVTKFQNAQEVLGLQDVFYGDQERIPRTPALCIEPGDKTRELNGAPRRTMTVITIYGIVYHNPIKSVQTIREEDDLLSENIESLIHQDPYFKDVTGNDQVLDSLVTSIESGYQVKTGSIFRASRLTIEARVQVQLPSTF